MLPAGSRPSWLPPVSGLRRGCSSGTWLTVGAGATGVGADRVSAESTEGGRPGRAGLVQDQLGSEEGGQALDRRCGFWFGGARCDELSVSAVTRAPSRVGKPVQGRLHPRQTWEATGTWRPHLWCLACSSQFSLTVTARSECHLTTQSRMGPQTPEGQLGSSSSGDVILLSLLFHSAGRPCRGAPPMPPQNFQGTLDGEEGAASQREGWTTEPDHRTWSCLPGYT